MAKKSTFLGRFFVRIPACFRQGPIYFSAFCAFSWLNKFVPIRVNSWLNFSLRPPRSPRLIEPVFSWLHKWDIAKWPGDCGRSFCRCLHRTKIRTKTPKPAKNKSASICVNLRLIKTHFQSNLQVVVDKNRKV